MRHFLVCTITGTCMLFLMWGLSACNKEAKLTPDTPPAFYTLPQGQHPYDDTIVAFYKKYGSYILYKYDSIDYIYNYTTNLTVNAPVANEAYIQSTLDFFRTQCLDYYPEAFLKQTMPFKILLAARMDTTRQSAGNPPITRPSVTNLIASRSMMLIGWADSTLLQQTPRQRRQLKAYLNRCYFLQALQSGALKIPDFFFVLTPPGGYNNGSGNVFKDGMIEASSSDDQGRQQNVTWDFLCFINAITGQTKAELEATILSPAVDVKGLVRQKYDGLIRYYKTTYGVDLQAIGDAQ